MLAHSPRELDLLVDSEAVKETESGVRDVLCYSPFLLLLFGT